MVAFETLSGLKYPLRVPTLVSVLLVVRSRPTSEQSIYDAADSDKRPPNPAAVDVCYGLFHLRKALL